MDDCEGASFAQIGEAAQLRYKKNLNLTKEERNELHEIVHSADSVGRFSEMPNKFKDTDCEYSDEAQKVIDKVKAKNPKVTQKKQKK